jgi:catechol 2,3-dioxygenase-like lactoylglutathione lyase family enzyme
MIDGYTDVAVVVADKEKAKAWYTQVLGLHAVMEAGHAICVSPDPAGESLMLHLCGDAFAPLEPGNTGIGFTADDIDSTVDDLEEKGVTFTVKPGPNDSFKVAKFLDPDGNEFWLFESRLAKVAKQKYGPKSTAKPRARRTPRRRATGARRARRTRK